jgi:aldehyde:ferredoxin oxidoreductase
VPPALGKEICPEFRSIYFRMGRKDFMHIVRVNMSDLTVKTEEVPAEWKTLGGRALTTTIVASEVVPTCHPLGPNNKLVFAPGMLSGTPAANSGRMSCGGKSPLTYGIKESNSGGTTAQQFAKLGIHAMIIEGRPAEDKWYRLHVDKDGVTIHEETEVVGMQNFAVIAEMEKRFGDKVGVMSIGIPGEKRMAAANISVKDPDHKIRSHGRGGMGAVMGSKKIKCITVDGTGAGKVEIADPEKFKKAAKVFAKALLGCRLTAPTSWSISFMKQVVCRPRTSVTASAIITTRFPARPCMTPSSSARDTPSTVAMPDV